MRRRFFSWTIGSRPATESSVRTLRTVRAALFVGAGLVPALWCVASTSPRSTRPARAVRPVRPGCEDQLQLHEPPRLGQRVSEHHTPSSVEDANSNHQHCVLPIVVRLRSLWFCWIRIDVRARRCEVGETKAVFLPSQAFFA